MKSTMPKFCGSLIHLQIIPTTYPIQYTATIFAISNPAKPDELAFRIKDIETTMPKINVNHTGRLNAISNPMQNGRI